MLYSKTISDEKAKQVRLMIKVFIFSLIKSIFVFGQKEPTFILIVLKIKFRIRRFVLTN